LPEPKGVPFGIVEGPCGLVPLPPPPWPMLVESPTDLGQCLPVDYPEPAVTVQVRVAPDGHARSELGYYDQCSGRTFVVPPAVERCFQEKLHRWKWEVIETCPARPLDQDYVLAAHRPSSPGATSLRNVAALPTGTSIGCAG
jgi:hypothetical protein